MKAAIRMDNFSSGELSPRVLGRTDLPQYHTGMRQMKNWMIQPQGSTTRRPGTQYISTTKGIAFPGATSQSSGTGNHSLQGVAYAPSIGTYGRWVAVGDTTGVHPIIIHSDDNGVTWVAAGTIPATNFSLNAVCWTGSLFCTVGGSNGTQAIIFTSPDGDVWTARTGTAGAHDMATVIWTGTLFVAAGVAGASQTSPDGITWTAGSGLANATYYAVAQGTSEMIALTGPSSVNISGIVRSETNYNITAVNCVRVLQTLHITLTIGAHNFAVGDLVTISGTPGTYFPNGTYIVSYVPSQTMITTYLLFGGSTTNGTVSYSGTAGLWFDEITVASASGMTVGDSITTTSVVSTYGYMNEVSNIFSIVGSVVKVKATVPSGGILTDTYSSGGTLTDNAIATSLYTSPNGKTWTVGVTSVGFAAVFWKGYFYIGGLGISRTLNSGTPATIVFATAFPVKAITQGGPYLIAIGDSGEFAYTLDGVNWQQTTIGTVGFRGIGYSSGAVSLMMVGFSNGSNAIIYTQIASTYPRRLWPFVGSTGNPYMMEWGHLYVRFLRPDANGVVSYVQSSPGVPLEVTTGYQAQQLAALQFAQANDVLYIAHSQHPPRKLVRTSEFAFTLTNLMDSTTPNTNIFTSTYKLVDGPYLDENGTVTTVTLSGTGTGSKTATASSALWTSPDVGRVMRIRDSAAGNLWGWGIITAYSSSTSVTIYMMTDPSTTNACTRWAIGAWGNTPGFPAAVTFFQQRLCWGGAAAEPMSVKCSVTAAFEQYSPTQIDDTSVADNAVYFTVASKRMAAIQWMTGELSLAVGTKGGVYFVDGGATVTASYGSPLAPGAASVRKASDYDCDPCIPATVGDTIVFVQKGGRLVRALDPVASGNTYAQPNLTLFADQITQGGLLEIVFAATPNMAVWGRCAGGTLIGMTFDPSTREMGWHEHPLAGALSGANQPLVMSIGVLPIFGHDQLFLAVRRTVNGAQVEFIEALTLPFDSVVNTLSQAWYLDAATLYVGPPTTSISGLDYLEGQTVAVFGDGVQQTSQVVSSGAITITSASTVLVGLAYDTLSPLETMPARMPTRALLTGVIAGDGAKVTIQAAVLELVDTAGLMLGPGQGGTLNAITDELGTVLTGSLITDFEKVAPVGGAAALLSTMMIQPIGPYPATLTGLCMFVDGANPNA